MTDSPKGASVSTNSRESRPRDPREQRSATASRKPGAFTVSGVAAGGEGEGELAVCVRQGGCGRGAAVARDRRDPRGRAPGRGVGSSTSAVKDEAGLRRVAEARARARGAAKAVSKRRFLRAVPRQRGY